MRKPPSLWSIVWTDNLSHVLACIGPVFFSFALLEKLTGT